MNVLTNQAAHDVVPPRHFLFVEGDSQQSIDPTVFEVLFEDQLTSITIRPIGASFHVKSAAQAMARHHPHYYFLVDRDHHQDHEVDDSWNNFPNQNTHNLLVWRKREIENYFLDPGYLSQSAYLKSKITAGKLRSTILKTAQARLYLDVANQVIVSIREECKEAWIEIFSDPTMFKTRDSALAQLKKRPEFPGQLGKISKLCGDEKIEERFNEYLNRMTGGKDTLEYGSGRWLDFIRGKPVLSQVINACFEVKDSSGQPLSGSEKITYIAKKLLQNANGTPQDFLDIKRLICQRLS